MAHANLRNFIESLEKEGQLVRVSAPVSTVLEMTEIQTRLLAENGPAVLFENVIQSDGTKSDMPVLANLFGTVERVALGMGRPTSALRTLGEQLAFLRQPADTFRKYPESDRSIAGRFARSIAFHKKRQTQMALDLIAGLIDEHPEDPYFHEFLGQILLESGRPDEAVDPITVLACF